MCYFGGPECGCNCIVQQYVTAEESCASQSNPAACICGLPSYQIGWYGCVENICSATDYQTWISLAQSLCLQHGVAWPSPSAVASSTTAVATSPAITTPVVNPVASTLSITGLSTTFEIPVTVPGLSTATVTSPNVFTFPTGSGSSQGSGHNYYPHKSSSAGKKAGISVGAIAGAVLLALWVWFRRRQRKSRQQQSKPAIEPPVEASPYNEMNGKQIATAGVAEIRYPPQLPDQSVKGSPATHTTEISPIHTSTTSPTSAYVEAAGVVPTEMHSHTSFQPSLTSGPQLGYVEADSNGYVEADAALLSHNITSPISELDAPLYLPSQSATSNPQTPPTSRAAGDDLELERMKKEIEALRVEKDRIQQLADMEAREKELSRRIVERELRQ